jgi:hypothetical protein
MKHHDPAERWFDLNGVWLHVSAEDAALITPLLSYLGELSGQPAPDAATFRLTIARELPQAVPSGARLLYDGPLPEGTPCRMSLDGEWHWVEVPDRLSLRFSASCRRAHMQVAPGAEALAGGSATMLALDAALRMDRQLVLHAAALELPSREAAIALLAPSGAGKTTTSLALALQGFALMTDDAAVLIPGEAASGAAPRVWGLPRPLKVHRRTAELLPRIGGLLGGEWNAEDEQAIPRTALRSVAGVVPPRPTRLAGLVMLGPRICGGHRLQPVSKADLLAAVAADSLFCSRQGILDDDLDRYRSLARTVIALPALELNVGSSLEGVGRSVLAAFG